MTKTQTKRKLTALQQLFVSEYLIDLNATQAAIRAGYSAKNAKQIGSQLLDKTRLQEEIQKSMDARAERIEIDADYVLQRLHEIESFDFGEIINEDGSMKPVQEWPEAIRRSVSSIEVEEDWAGKGKNREMVGYTKKIKIEGRTKPLELIARHLGMLDTKIELDAKDGFVELLERTKNSPLGSPQGLIRAREDEKKKIH